MRAICRGRGPLPQKEIADVVPSHKRKSRTWSPPTRSGDTPSWEAAMRAICRGHGPLLRDPATHPRGRRLPIKGTMHAGDFCATRKETTVSRLTYFHQHLQMASGQSYLLRKGRFSEANRIYHVSSVTKNRARIFSSFQCGRILVGALRREEEAGRAETLTFVIMPDHFHWLMRLNDGSVLSKCVGRVKSGSARLINKQIRRSGKFWQDGFHDHAIRAEEDIVDIARYIVANPLRAGIVRSIRDYPLWDATWI